MFLIRETALKILTFCYQNCSKYFKIDNFDFEQFGEEDDVLKSIRYLHKSNYLIMKDRYEEKYPFVGDFEITVKGIDWVEDNLNTSEQS